ncbi:glycosyltransferase family 2 protein, partial [Caballeronia sp. INML3]
MFWSLNFACHLNTFEQIGGFDDAYTGYGGEDTDFAFRAKR